MAQLRGHSLFLVSSKCSSLDWMIVHQGRERADSGIRIGTILGMPTITSFYTSNPRK